MRAWLIVTPEYPPDLGGVGDFTRTIARGLSERGERVQVFAPSFQQPPADPGVELMALGDRFLQRSCLTLDRALRQHSTPPIVLLQYVPHGFGLSGLNLPFFTWLAARAARLWVMFHEVVFPFVPGQPFRRDLRAVGTRLMLVPLGSRAERCLISTEGWAPYLRTWARLRSEPEWLPVPSSLPARAERPAAAVREALGLSSGAEVLFHFGTYSPAVVEPLQAAAPSLLDSRPGRVLLLLGRGGEGFRAELLRRRPDLGARVVATGALPAQAIADAMAACDAGIYPFPDGVSGRRSSLMAALQLGVPVLTTEGRLSERLWRASRAVALAPATDAAAFVDLVDRTLSDRAELARLGAAERELYDSFFARERCLERLLAVD